MTKKTMTPRFRGNVAQKIYLKRAGVASRIYAKYADSGSVPTNLVNGGGIKPLTNQNQQQQPAQQPAATTPPAQPQQPTQPAAKPIEPIPANVPPPPVVPAPQSGLPPAQPMAPAAPPPLPSKPVFDANPFADVDAPPAKPTTPQAGTITESGQISGQTGGQPDPNQQQTPVNPQQTGGQPGGQTAGQPEPNKPPAAQFNEQELAQFDQMQDPKQFGSAFEKMTPEQQQQVAPRWVQKWANDPKNKPIIDGAKDLYSNDPQKANSPAAKQAQEYIKGLPQQLQNQFTQENFQKYMAANPNATPQEQAGFMRQAYDQAAQSVQAMPWPAQLMMGLGLGAGLVGLFSSMFGEGGMETGLMGLLGIGAAGLIGANYGMFGNDARMMVGQGAVGLGRMMGMKIPDAKAFTPEGMEQAKADAMTSVMEAIGGNAEKKIPTGGWQGGIKKIEELRSPLDQLANTAETYGRDFAITTLMGAMNTNDPSVAQQKFDMLMKQRQEMMDPQYLRNQMGPLAGLVEMQFGKYPGEAPAQAAPPQ